MKSLLKIILKTKDEEFLLETWIKYYIKLVGAENIIIFDDYSTSEIVLDLYKKYPIEVRTIPNLCNIDGIHCYKELHKEMKDACDYYTIIDTDEFLCFYDYENDRIDNSKLLPFIKQNNDRLAFPTTWLYNLYKGQDYSSVLDVTDFDFNLNIGNTRLGKFIASSCGGAGGNIGHNSTIKSPNSEKFDLKFCPELLLLHINNANWESRIKTKINYARSLGEKFENIQELIEACKAKDKKLFYHSEILGYLTDRENFINKKTSKNYEKNLPILRTNIIKSFIEDLECETNLLNFLENKKEYIRKFFKEGFKQTEKFNLLD
jgi:hypothetical protein